MTNAVIRHVRRLAVALLALVCLSPAALRVPALPPLPQMLGLAPEPVAVTTQAALTEPFAAAPMVTDVSGDAAVQGAPARPDRQTARQQRAAAKARRTLGQALPTLPPDEVPRGRYHRVEAGETVASIAAAYSLRSQWAVYDANPVIVDPNQPPAGVWLYIPHPSMDTQPRPRPGQPGYSTEPSGTVMVDSIWLQLAACESSGDWGINTGNNYYGGLQFTLSSWRAVGGAGYPHEAHPMEQIARADYLQRIQGWQAWPMCAGKLGLIPQAEADAIVQRARAKQAGAAKKSSEGGRSGASEDGGG